MASWARLRSATSSRSRRALASARALGVERLVTRLAQPAALTAADLEAIAAEVVDQFIASLDGEAPLETEDVGAVVEVLLRASLEALTVAAQSLTAVDRIGRA